MEQTQQPKSNRGIYILILMVVLLLAGAVVFALQNSQPDPDTSGTTQTQTETETEPTDTAADSATTPSESITIGFTDNGFKPQQVTVKKGTVITVTNNSSKNVQFSSDDHPVHRDNTEMNLKTLSPGESATYTASTVGTWGFHDHLDDSKTGTVTVTE